MVEAQFDLRSVIASASKFYTVMALLPAEVVAKIPATVLDAQNYDELKKNTRFYECF